MSFIVSSKKVHDSSVTVFLDPTLVLWTCAEDVLQVLRLPLSVLQSIPLRHKKCWNDFRNNSCRLEGNRVFIDIFALGNLCNRVNSSQSDFLCTQFIADTYKEALTQSNLPPPFPTPDLRPSPGNECVVPEYNKPHHHHHHHHNDLLDKISKQNDLIINGLGQLCLNNNNQHMEITNILNSIKLQNVTISGQLTQLIDLLNNQLTNITTDLSTLLEGLDDRLQELLASVEKSLSQLQDSVRNELTNISSILNNLTSSVTNINATLNNVLQTLGGLDVGNLTTILTGVVNSVDEILSILTPPLTKKQHQ
ncbi:calyx/pep [Erannis ankeraria nucleopolyhedrovirus]|uniref:calyx/pep n=1 Tax=Erannis ankeraria nucleopolyhedrovirus TaxID=2913600 RepID=UPI001179ED8E|nr:calyx/pep [Erannis ankeraria nucleopolyhedrovirus]UJZ88997.1 calyx/pep [Erannis ankeraria nucleopolyhedrovirus]